MLISSIVTTLEDTELVLVDKSEDSVFGEF
jgi:hypothetical protein